MAAGSAAEFALLRHERLLGGAETAEATMDLVRRAIREDSSTFVCYRVDDTGGGLSLSTWVLDPTGRLVSHTTKNIEHLEQALLATMRDDPRHRLFLEHVESSWSLEPDTLEKRLEHTLGAAGDAHALFG